MSIDTGDKVDLNTQKNTRNNSDDGSVSVSDNISGTIENIGESIGQARDEMINNLAATMYTIKPKLRGIFHLITLPAVVIGGIVLLVFTPSVEARAAVSFFVFSSIILFSVSATYHRTNGWVQERTKLFLQKMDHASISVLIAGTSTPLAVFLLDGGERIFLLAVVWGAAMCSVLAQFFTIRAPKYAGIVLYLAFGFVPVYFIASFYVSAQQFGEATGLWIFILICAGGLMYSVGGILFAWRPSWLDLSDSFGYHEWFHIFTILGFFCHYGAVSLMAYTI